MVNGDLELWHNDPAVDLLRLRTETSAYDMHDIQGIESSQRVGSG